MTLTASQDEKDQRLSENHRWTRLLLPPLSPTQTPCAQPPGGARGLRDHRLNKTWPLPSRKEVAQRGWTKSCEEQCIEHRAETGTTWMMPAAGTGPRGGYLSDSPSLRHGGSSGKFQ